MAPRRGPVPYVDACGKVVDAKTHAARRALGNRFRAALKLSGHSDQRLAQSPPPPYPYGGKGCQTLYPRPARPLS